MKKNFEEFWAPIAAVIGAVVLVINFLDALSGNKTIATFALILISLAVIIAGTWQYAFALSNKPYEKNGKYGFYPKHKFHWAAKVILFLSAMSILVSIIYILIIIEIVPDCCGVIPTATPTVTSTATPSQTPQFTDISGLFLTSTFTPTFTPPPTNTNTFTPSPTSTQTPNPNIFKGFDRNCIDSDYWTPYVYPGEATPEPSDCLDLSTRGISSQDSGLRINIKDIPYSVFSMSTKLPKEDFVIHYKIKFEAFTSKSSDIAAILVFGIGPSDDWVLKNGSYLTYSILQGSTTNEVLEQTGTNKLKPDYLLHRFFSPREIDVRIVIKGIDMTVFIDNATYGFFPVSLSKPGSRANFWIGYQLPTNQSTLKAIISEFTIVETK